MECTILVRTLMVLIRLSSSNGFEIEELVVDVEHEILDEDIVTAAVALTGMSGPIVVLAPEWDGETTSFQDYAIKARLWLATTKAKAKTRGPLLLQKLSKVPFESMKFLAKDAGWMASTTNGEDLIKMMDQADYFGEDRDEDLLSDLARITYHLRRDKGEGHRSFFGKWDVAMRKVVEHRVDLPTKFVGFLMINALALSETDIKNLLNYTRGSIEPADIREWVRKHETKLPGAAGWNGSSQGQGRSPTPTT